MKQLHSRLRPAFQLELFIVLLSHWNTFSIYNFKNLNFIYFSCKFFYAHGRKMTSKCLKVMILGLIQYNFSIVHLSKLLYNKHDHNFT